jgi:RHS repeat-associated protein
VRVALLNHPEFGYTFTRTDGMFDLAVNASSYTVDFQAIGYCPAQRQVQAPIQDFRTLKDVVMVPLDSVATPVSFGSNAPPQFASSSVQVDASGARSTRVFFPAGTAAGLVLPDGSTQVVDGLTLHITEVTVGSNGPAAMPAPLPPTSAYTFCADFSADEALSLGARSIRFNQPIWSYVDNFLRLPVGTLVPSGYYDLARAAWVPQENGLVIQILGVTNGLAQVDLAGSGMAADSGALATNQFSSAELQQLAATYATGSSLWRMPMAHFTPVDFNNALSATNRTKPQTQSPRPIPSPCDNCPNDYGTANFTSQVFEEAIPLVGVAMALHYSSARVPDYRELAQAVVPLLPTVVPDGVIGVSLRSEIAGVVKDLPYTLTPGSTAIVSWDGYDAYGRFVGGSQNANIEVDYYYPINYGLTPSTGSVGLPLFGSFGQTNSSLGHAGGTLMTSANFTRTLTIPDHRSLGLGGWSLTPHHRYDPVQRYLYLGDGTVRQPERLGNGVQRLLDFDSVPGLYGPGLVATGPDGTVFFLAYFGNGYPRLLKRSPAGRYSFLSGDPSQPGLLDIGSASGLAAADGQSALKSDAGHYVYIMKAGPDGSLYIRSTGIILRIDPQGILHVVLGFGPYGFTPDGTSARAAYCQANGEGSLAIAPDGTVYYDDSWYLNGAYYNFIRKVAMDGRIFTLMGQAGPLLAGEDWHNLMGQAAASTRLNPVADLALGPEGSLYVACTEGYPYYGGIFKITPGGLTETVLYTVPISYLGHEYLSSGGWTGDQGHAAANSNSFGLFYSGVYVTGLQVAPDGSVLFQHDIAGAQSEGFVWRITPNGIMQLLAGRGWYAAKSAPLTALDGGNPLNTRFQGIGTFGLGPDNSLTLIDASVFGVLRIAPSLSGFTGQELQIPSEDASEVYVFDALGNHLRTLNGLTGTTNWSFAYDANNLVTDLRDANGLVTHIERNGADQPTDIIGPYGQRTTLALDGNGFLSAVVNPVGEATMLTHTQGGLLTSITRPLGDTDAVAYDSLGLVSQIRDPVGGGYDMSRSDFGTQINIRSATTISNVDTRTLILLDSEDSSIAATYADDTSASLTLFQSGLLSASYSDGSAVNYGTAGDPRFPEASRVMANESVQLPGGLTYALTISRSAALSDTSNPFSVATLSSLATLNGQVWTTSYNGTSRVWMATSPEGRRATTGLDGQGRIIHQQMPGQTPMDVLYDAQGRVSEVDDTASVGLRRTTFNYDSLGRLRTWSDPLGRTNQYSYDGAGRLQQLTLADGQVANFQSDAEFHLTAVTPPGRPSHRFFYNTVGLVTNYVPPAVNNVDESVHYGYDADRNLTRISLPDGQSVLFTRGPGGRIDQLVLGSGPTQTYAYSPNNGLPTNVASTTGDSLRWNYESFFITSTTWSGTITGSVSLTLNANFLPASQTVNGLTIAYSYDRDQLLTQAGNLTVTNDPVSGFITGTSLGSVTDQRQFDDRGLLTNYAARVSGTSVWSVALAYDLADRLTNKVQTVGGTTRTFGYVYDVAGRLQQVWQNGALAASYTYDANGNRLTRNAESATYDAQDRVQTYAGASFGWALSGDLHTLTSGGQTTTYTYDVVGALTAVAPPGVPQIDYIVDAAGRRIGKKVGGTLQRGWLWDDDQIIAEVDANSVVVSRFVYAADDQTPSYLIKGATTYRILSDERGSVRLVVNIADGTIAQQLDYDEFGRVLSDTAPGLQPFGFAGGLYDPVTGLVRFGERDYSAQTGQWTARDPIDFDGGQFSLYAYAGNDPVNSIDTTGTVEPWPGGLNNETLKALNSTLTPPKKDSVCELEAQFKQRKLAAMKKCSEHLEIRAKIKRLEHLSERLDKLNQIEHDNEPAYRDDDKRLKELEERLKRRLHH